MTQTTQEIIAKFDHLPIDEQKEVIKIILRRNVDIETPVLSDEEFVLNAEDNFFRTRPARGDRWRILIAVRSG